MSESCSHQWAEEVDTCRSCKGTDLGLAEFATETSGQGIFRVKTEPLYGDYCMTCDDFTMVSSAQHCELCGEVRWLSTMDEEISGE